MTLIYLTLAWVLGIVMAERFDPPYRVVLPILAFAATGLLIHRKTPSLRWTLGLLLMFGLGMLRFEAGRPDANSQHILNLNDRGSLQVIGRVIEEPRTRDTGLQVLVSVEQAAGRPYEGRLLVNLPRTSAVSYGDRVELFGVLRSPPDFDTFAYRDYLARQGVYSVMNGASVQVLETDTGSPFYSALLSGKDRAREFVQRTLPEPQASLLVGILLGDESGIPSEVDAAFSRTGAAHIVAISGFNMVILAQVMMSILRRLTTERRAAFFGVLAILIYTIFVGASAAVLRAALMSCLLIVGQALKRKSYVPTSLAFTALLLSLIDPFTLWDVGFQLSFAAVMGMALFVTPLERGLETLMKRLTSEERAEKWLKILSEPLVVTTAAQITTTPIILAYFGSLSLVSPLVNFLIIPVQPLLLLLGVVGVLIGVFIPPLGALFLLMAWVFLTWTVEIVTFFADLPFASTELSLSPELVLIGFVLLLMWVVYRATRPRWMLRLGARLPAQGMARFALIGGLIALVLLGDGLARRPDGRLHVTFLDVGESNGILIQSPRGGIILVDGGRFPSRLLDNLGARLPARTRHIDVLIITSHEETNIAALLEVVERYSIGTALIVHPASDETPTYQSLLETLTEKNIPLVTLTDGYRITVEDGVQIRALIPSGAAEGEARLLLRLEYGESAFLLTGDVDATHETALLSNPHLIQTSVLQIPAHGDNDSSSLPFVEVARPQVAVLQVDAGSPRGLPSPTVIDRFSESQLFRTDEDGAITISTDGQTLWVDTEE